MLFRSNGPPKFDERQLLREEAKLEAALAEARKRLANAKSQANRNRLKAQVNNLENAVRQLKNRPEQQASARASAAAANVAETERQEAAALQAARNRANRERQRTALEKAEANRLAMQREALGAEAKVLSSRERNALRAAVNKMGNSGLKKVSETLLGETAFNLATALKVIARYRTLHRGRPNVANAKFIKNLRVKIRAATTEQQKQLMKNIKEILELSDNLQKFGPDQVARARNLLAQYNRIHRGRPGFANNRNVYFLRERLKF